MTEPKKESAMLCDVQYVKEDRKHGIPDYLYVIWKDLTTGEKHLITTPNPTMDIYFEKHEFRNHTYNKNYARLEELDKRTVPYKDILKAIANDMGPEGYQYMSNAYNTGNFKALQQMKLYPYVYGADYDIQSWYRIQWLITLDNDTPKKLKKGFLDIESDGLEVPGMPSPKDCPINAVTLIDDWDKVVYTFILTDREFIGKDTTGFTQKQLENEANRKKMYLHMYEEQAYMRSNKEEFNKKLHELFDESYGYLEYKQYFYTDERKMLVHLFQLINDLKLDFIGIWNISFDIPYIIDRLETLGLDPKTVMSHPDFPSKKCYFKHDFRNHEIKNKSDAFLLTSYTVFYDQMELYAAIRKGASELRSYKLTNIANKEIKDTKLDYSEDGNIKTLPYTNFEKFIIYNIKDVLLQMGIERRTTDFDTLYSFSYLNATVYDKVFKQTVKLRNVQYLSFLSQGLIPGENININNKENKEVVKSESEDDDEDDFEGALVADPQYNGYVGIELYGKPSNNVFGHGIDFDMSAFYPNSIQAMNIDPSTLIFKMIMLADQFKTCGGKLKYHGITDKNFNVEDDVSKECIDNFQTRNYLTFGHKWLNLPSIDKICKRIEKEMK